jgi:hypothetical protein
MSRTMNTSGTKAASRRRVCLLDNSSGMRAFREAPRAAARRNVPNV